MEDEGIVHAVNVTGRAGNHGLGNLAGLGGIVGIHTDGNLQLEAVGQLGPFAHISVVDDILLGHHNLVLVLEGRDIGVQLFHEEVVQVFHVVILGSKRTAVTVLGSFGVLDVTVDIDGIDGTVDGQDTAHGSIGLVLGMLVGLDILFDIILVAEHGDVGRLAVNNGSVHTVGTLGEDSGVTHLAPSEIVSLVVEPEQIVIGLEQRLGAGGQERRFGRGNGIRLLVQFGKLVAARSEADYREHG